MTEEHMIKHNTVEQSSKEQVLDRVLDGAKVAVGKKKKTRKSPVRVNIEKINQWCTLLRKKLDRLLAMETEDFERNLASRVQVCFIWLSNSQILGLVF